MDKIALNEQQYVEEPFLRQLERLEWKVIRAGEQGKYDPAITLREGFNEVIIEKELRASLLNINRWLEDDQITDIIREITVPQSNGLIQINKEILEKLLENTSRDNRKTGERSETVRFIDFKNPEKNSFLAISQFKVNIPGTEKHIIPDIVLFINGLPLAVIECKSPYISDPIGEAVIQLMRYSNRREVKEGNEKLFWYNQILIATSRQTAKYSTITGEYEYFIEWKDPYPAKLSDIETEGSESVNSQQVLIQGILKKENLLDIIQSFIVFQEDTKGKMVKIAPRYQQYRTVLKIINRLKSDKAPNLLQAIARVNRVYKNKNGGFVVDYVGVVKHLREALAVFDKKDVEEILKVVKDDEKDIDELRYNHLQLKEFFKKYGISDINDIDACVDILVDEEIRNDFLALFRMFVKSMDRVLPKTEALQYVKDLKKFSFIGQAARNRYRDEKLSIKDASKKIRDIVDEYLISLGVDPKIPPLPIFSEKFKLKISQEKSDKAKSEELKIAIREHINDCLEEDPELYERFSDRIIDTNDKRYFEYN